MTLDLHLVDSRHKSVSYLLIVPFFHHLIIVAEATLGTGSCRRSAQPSTMEEFGKSVIE